MGANAGPDIVSDGLVLALDTADNNSFRGEPTTNKAGGVYLGFNGSRWGKVTDYPQKGSLPFEVKGDVYELLSGNNYWGNASSFSPAYNKTYTLSFWYYLSTDTNLSSWHNSFFGVPQGGGSQYATVSTKSNDTFSTTGTNTWRFGSVNISTNIAVDSYTYFRGTYTQGSADSMPNGDIYIANFQLEEKTSATRFTTGTRGTTVATGGGWADISGNSNHGEILNGTSTSNDNTVLGALDFDGSNDYIDLGTPSNLTSIGASNFTIECIIKPNTISTGWTGLVYLGRFGQSNGHLGFNPSNNVSGGTGDGSSWQTHQTTYTLSAGTWYHLIMVRVNNTINFYANGSSIGSFSHSYTPSTATEYLEIGNGSSGEYFAGNIASVKIYNQALSASEVLQNYNAFKTRFGL